MSDSRKIHLSPSQPSDAGDRIARGLAEKIRSTCSRVVVHLINSAANTFGDDVVGRRIRLTLLQVAGAHLSRSAHILGGGYFSSAANLRVGQRCLINRNCYLDLYGPILIDDDVVIGHGTSIITARHRIGPAGRRAGAVEGAPVAIGAGVWIGANATLLPGVRIGRGAVVAAGAVVTRDVEDNVVVAGIPARRLYTLD